MPLKRRLIPQIVVRLVDKFVQFDDFAFFERKLGRTFTHRLLREGLMRASVLIIIRLVILFAKQIGQLFGRFYYS